ncbi:efflux RND transporter periplasmic adaptor subunit [Massilia niabensis]|uniref:Efflux RND transporter periplasmic adaptor subunit n=1 Tax=Massilia niabensis TaxID=544910 RepID=A0ABW0L2U6_9BURK
MSTKNSRATGRGILALALASLFLAGCGKTEAPAPSQAAPAVTVVTLQAQELTLTRELSGRVTPSLIAEVRPQVGGIVTKRLFVEGEMVKAGQPLYQLSDPLYEADVASASAALGRARATLRQAELNARRSAELVEIDAVSRQDNENAQAALAQAKADVGVAQAALQRSRVTLSYARIDAPIGGHVGKSTVTAGALVTASQPAPLTVVQRLDPLYVDVTQSSSELLQLRQEMSAGKVTTADNLPIQILLEDGTPYAHKGKLAFADVTVDQTTGSYTVRAVVPNPEGLLLPGMFVRAKLGDGVRPDAILVPQQGVARDPRGNATVMVVNKAGKVEARQVVVNRAVGNQWLVDQGLMAGDRVVIEGAQKIKPGISVTATEAKPAAQAASTAAAQLPAKS